MGCVQSKHTRNDLVYKRTPVNTHICVGVADLAQSEAKTVVYETILRCTYSQSQVLRDMTDVYIYALQTVYTPREISVYMRSIP